MRKLRDSHIVGDFEGWDGDKVYELDDGSRWELTLYQYKYVYRHRPRVRIWQDGGRYLFDVEGMNGKVEVRAV